MAKAEKLSFWRKWDGGWQLEAGTSHSQVKPYDLSPTSHTHLGVGIVMIVSYETLRTLTTHLANCNIGLLLCDEGHRLKNSG